MAHDVFISYSSHDKPIADAVCALLESEKLRCWIAPRDILPGDVYMTSIVRALTASRILVFIFSDHANRSTHVTRELEIALNGGLEIIPFRTEDTPPSEALKYLVSTCHWLDALDPPLEDHARRLAAAIKVRLGAPLPVPERASARPNSVRQPPPVAKVSAQRTAAEKAAENSKESPPHPVVGRGWSNSLGMAFCGIEPGRFLMGSPTGEADRWSNEVEHPVRFTLGYWMGKYPVTQGEWKQVMHSDLKRQRRKSIVAWLRDRSELGDRVPMTYVNWKDCRAFCKRLTELEHSVGSLGSGWRYDLPTESQWEYSCRSNSNMPFSVGNGFELTEEDANFGRQRNSPTEVGSYSPNAWGLHDMQGNVWEWCLDWQAPYPSQEQIDPKGPAKGDDRVIRGGCFFSKEQRSCRSANRGMAESWSRNWRIGFRVAIIRNPVS